MAQTLTSLLVHVVFSTKDRRQLINADAETRLHSYLSKALGNMGSPCLAIGGTANHVHLLISLSKNAALSALIGEAKKASSKWLKSLGSSNHHFAWQEGYGAFSIGQSQVEHLKRYIASQHEHHKTRTFEEELLATLKRYTVEHDEQYLWE
jgi:putative transposase